MVQAMLVAAGPFLVLFALGMIGGGDVKLMAAVGALCGSVQAAVDALSASAATVTEVPPDAADEVRALPAEEHRPEQLGEELPQVARARAIASWVAS